MHDDDELETFERIRKAWPGGTMPASSEHRARAAKRQTHKSKRVARKIGRSSDGIHKRRRKRVD